MLLFIIIMLRNDYKNLQMTKSTGGKYNIKFTGSYNTYTCDMANNISNE